MKKTCYEYELDMGSQSLVLTEECPSNNPVTFTLSLRSQRADIRLGLNPYDH